MGKETRFASKVADAIIKGIVVHGFENDKDAATVVEGQRTSIENFLIDALIAYDNERLGETMGNAVDFVCKQMRTASADLIKAVDLIQTLAVSRQDAWDALKKENENGKESTT